MVYYGQGLYLQLYLRAYVGWAVIRVLVLAGKKTERGRSAARG